MLPTNNSSVQTIMEIFSCSGCKKMHKTGHMLLCSHLICEICIPSKKLTQMVCPSCKRESIITPHAFYNLSEATLKTPNKQFQKVFKNFVQEQDAALQDSLDDEIRALEESYDKKIKQLLDEKAQKIVKLKADHVNRVREISQRNSQAKDILKCNNKNEISFNSLESSLEVTSDHSPSPVSPPMNKIFPHARNNSPPPNNWRLKPILLDTPPDNIVHNSNNNNANNNNNRKNNDNDSSPLQSKAPKDKTEFPKRAFKMPAVCSINADAEEEDSAVKRECVKKTKPGEKPNSIEELTKSGENGVNQDDIARRAPVVCVKKFSTPNSSTPKLVFGKKGNRDDHFRYSKGVAVDDDGNIYVVDSENPCIRVWSKEGVHINSFGNLGSGADEFRSPWGIAVHGKKVYVTDFEKHQVLIFESNGKFAAAFGREGSGANCLRDPRGIYVSADGYIYVAEGDNNRVQVFNPLLRHTAFIGLNKLIKPRDVYFSEKTKEVCVLDWGKNCVHVFDKDKELLHEYGTMGPGKEMTQPWFMTMDTSGQMIISDGKAYKSDHALKVYSETGVFKHIVGERGVKPGMFILPRGISCSPSGDIIVADSVNYRMQVF